MVTNWQKNSSRANFKGIFVSVSKVSLSFFFKYSATANASTADESPPFAELIKQCKN